jgi:iron complex outermembrane recepter protein
MNKIILCALAAACLFTVALTAQTQDEQSDIEVIVTASRVEEPAEEVAAFVSVITAEELSASGQTTLVEALDGLAGIHFRSSSGNAAQAEISMRGFGENSHGRVLVLVDGRRLNRPDLASINWLEIPVENIERIEVVRGGSSILYGDAAVAGVINIITKKGASGFDVAVSGQYGSFNQNQEGVEISGSSDLASFSITG